MVTQGIRHGLSRLRWHMRRQSWVATAVYMLPNGFHALVHRRGPQSNVAVDAPCGRVARLSALSG